MTKSLVSELNIIFTGGYGQSYSFLNTRKRAAHDLNSMLKRDELYQPQLRGIANGEHIFPHNCTPLGAQNIIWQMARVFQCKLFMVTEVTLLSQVRTVNPPLFPIFQRTVLLIAAHAILGQISHFQKSQVQLSSTNHATQYFSA